eukprot:jgi/Bigna1/136426/aug1.34_g11134
MDEDRRQLDKALREANEWIAASSIHDGLGENEGYDEEEDEDEVLMQLDSGEEEEEDEVERNLQNQIFNVGVAFPAAIRRSADDDIGADTKSLTEHTVEMADDDRKHPPNPQRIPVTPESIANLKGAISQARKIISGLRNQLVKKHTMCVNNIRQSLLRIAENLKNYAYNLRKGCTVAKRANNKRFYTFATVVYKLPFFKDKNGSEPKPHPNVTLKEQMLEGSLSQQITTSRLETFTDDEKRRLENAVRIAKKREWIKEQVKNTRKTLETTSGDHRRKLVVASVKLIHRLALQSIQEIIFGCNGDDDDMWVRIRMIYQRLYKKLSHHRKQSKRNTPWTPSENLKLILGVKTLGSDNYGDHVYKNVRETLFPHGSRNADQLRERWKAVGEPWYNKRYAPGLHECWSFKEDQKLRNKVKQYTERGMLLSSSIQALDSKGTQGEAKEELRQEKNLNDEGRKIPPPSSPLEAAQLSPSPGRGESSHRKKTKKKKKKKKSSTIPWG